MLVNPTEALCGVPLVTVRDFLARHEKNVWHTRWLANAGSIPEAEVSEITTWLMRQGYVQPDGGLASGFWRNTDLGRVFACARLRKPVLRKTALRHLSQVSNRIALINHSESRWQVTLAGVLGNIVDPAAERIDGCDFVIRLENRTGTYHAETSEWFGSYTFERRWRGVHLSSRLAVIKDLQRQSAIVSVFVDRQIDEPGTLETKLKAKRVYSFPLNGTEEILEEYLWLPKAFHE